MCLAVLVKQDSGLGLTGNVGRTGNEVFCVFTTAPIYTKRYIFSVAKTFKKHF